MKYALALAGGGTRGAFQAGVWEALKELGIEVSAIVGASVGAVNGAAFAAGADVKNLWLNISASDIAKTEGDNMFSPSAVLSMLKTIPEGGLEADAFLSLLHRTIDEDAVRNSDIEYGLCTYNVNKKKGEELFCDEIAKGELIDYIFASACLPIFKAAEIDGERYYDGGLYNNLPIDMLTARGYDTIISVSVKGVGVVRPADTCGVNIIEINCKAPEVGIMEFDRESIIKSMKSGYFECMRVFGKYSGKIYSIDNASYRAAQLKLGSELLSGMEEAAQLCGADRYRVYTIPELAEEILWKYESALRLRLMVGAMEKSLPGKRALDALGKLHRAANAIIYLKKHRIVQNTRE